MNNKAEQLQSYYWPPVSISSDIEIDVLNILNLSPKAQKEEIYNLSDDIAFPKMFKILSVIGAYIFGYKDSPIWNTNNQELELKLLTTKTIIEDNLLARFDFFNLLSQSKNYSQIELNYDLKSLIDNNSSLNHPLFEFLQKNANQKQYDIFLLNEAIRNEIVDDEVALMSVGLQGEMKKTVVSNLWDECGRGKLNGFHTFWLRELIEDMQQWEDILDYRKNKRPWFTNITAFIFNCLITRPQYRMAAYGWFTINESWVAPHFEKILYGMDRVGIKTKGIRVYFEAHKTIDPYHYKELLNAVQIQNPALTFEETKLILAGAKLAIAANTKQYDYVTNYLSEL